jgi:tripartite-type tricarboxylate transporter receptor subunit TctC
MNKRLAYNPENDFEPVSLLLSNIKVLVVRKDLPAKNLKEFIAYTKANRAKMQYGSAGAGSATHMTCVLLNSGMGTPVTHVPYRGTALAMQDLIAGRIDYMCDVISTAVPHIKSGAVRPLALLSNERSQALPDLPTALEQGLKGVDGDGWNAFFFPKGTPQPIVRKLAAAASETIDTPAIAKRITDLGLILPGKQERGPEALARLVAEELKKWAGPVKESGVRID